MMRGCNMIEGHPRRVSLEAEIENGVSSEELAGRYRIPVNEVRNYRKAYLLTHPGVVERQAEGRIERPVEKEKPPTSREEQERIILDSLNPLFVAKKAKLKKPLPPVKITPLLKTQFREHCILLNVRIPEDPGVYLKALRKWGQAQAEQKALLQEAQREALGLVAGDDTGTFAYWGSPEHIQAFQEARKPPRDLFLEWYNR